MNKKESLLLFVVSLIFFGALAALQTVPGYMDAEYYFGQAINFSQGHGFQEYFIWNYLNDPAGIPAAGFTFWLPLTSFIASIGLWVSKSTDFFMARMMFILLAACIPVITAGITGHFASNKRAGWLAGGLALFSGFYLPYLTITDNFTPFMFLGGLFFLLVIKITTKTTESNTKLLHFLFLGMVAGLMTLTRSEGLLWLAGGVLTVFLVARRDGWRVTRFFIYSGIIGAGFLICMAPWYVHNYSLFEAIYPPGNRLMFWMTRYDDLFLYPAGELTAERWQTLGFSSILIDRLKAAGTNIQTLIATGADIFLFPLLIAGYWKNRRNTSVIVFGWMLLLTLVSMSFIFPYAGARGGFFHSLSSMQPLLWALIAVGLEIVIQWGVKHRNWKYNRAWLMFGAAIVLTAAALSGFILNDKLTHGLENEIPWNDSQNAYQEIETGLINQNIGLDETVMINNPPGFTLATGRQSVMIPAGGAGAILTVCERYDVSYLVVNNERQDVQRLLVEETAMAETFTFLFETSGSSVYEYQP